MLTNALGAGSCAKILAGAALNRPPPHFEAMSPHATGAPLLPEIPLELLCHIFSFITVSDKVQVGKFTVGLAEIKYQLDPRCTRCQELDCSAGAIGRIACPSFVHTCVSCALNTYTSDVLEPTLLSIAQLSCGFGPVVSCIRAKPTAQLYLQDMWRLHVWSGGRRMCSGRACASGALCSDQRRAPGAL